MTTWKIWFPESIFGPINKRTMTHTIEINDDKLGTIYFEVMFRALDRPGDVAKLLSMEVTGGWVNEAREVPKGIIDTLTDRVGQYPQQIRDDEGNVVYGCTWGGVFMDTNAPDHDHWWFELEAKPPKNWKFFAQPGALVERKGQYFPNPKAENIKNLNEGMDYYLKRLEGKKESYIRVYYCNEFGYVEENRRVHEEYNDNVHCAVDTIVPDIKLPVSVGLDFGLTPAAIFGQRTSRGQWRIFHEITTERIGIKRFGEILLLPYLLGELDGFEVKLWGDPSGEDGSSSSEETPFQILDALGIHVKPAPSQDPTLRREALAAPLERLIDGEPGCIVDKSLSVFRKGMSSKFYYKRIQVVGDDRYQDKPYKNFWSHICEAAEYLMIGEGEGKALTRRIGMAPSAPPSRPKYYRSGQGWMAN